jgi:hypothetical protein
MEIAKVTLEYLRILIWPLVIITLFHLFRNELSLLLKRVKQASLPGSISFELSPWEEAQKQIAEVKEISNNLQKEAKTTTVGLSEANRRMSRLGLTPSPSELNMSYYREFAEKDPRIALAGLRIEIDILARNLAKGFRIPLDPSDTGMRLLNKLFYNNAITSEQIELVKKVYSSCNVAIHGLPITRADALAVIDVAEILLNQYINWLSWGFENEQ